MCITVNDARNHRPYSVNCEANPSVTLLALLFTLILHTAVFTQGPTWAMARAVTSDWRQIFRTRIFIVPFHDLSIHAYDMSL